MFKRSLIIGLGFAGGLLLLPSLVVTMGSDDEEIEEQPEAVETSQNQAFPEIEETSEEESDSSSGGEGLELDLKVYRANTETVETVPLETYVAGVVASEMPADFEAEALKAQALTARTYIIQQLLYEDAVDIPQEADVTDTDMHQVYQSKSELEEAWADDFRWKMARIEEAVQATAGEIILHEEEPITASFFSTSNGRTENAEDYWDETIPYLQSVESPWDEESPRFEGETRLPIEKVEEQLNVRIDNGQLEDVNARTEGERVKEVSVGGEVFKGREVREALNLDSSDFNWRVEGEEVVIETRGWGHGVGMSQYGAEGMARSGHTYEEIIHHYYQDVTIAGSETIAEALRDLESVNS
ncbi:stage II sporulation protein D [Salsuginibacillus kocurii]|uniref:stage II sporulation protein D n=1 Tax=Salsuginibacillus kocurii TaxID=427078 RepID=UPI0003609392|nr:stage II sporulation protein D [Salsuginibacillus kocurii]